ncbi:hypothetical protein CT157_22645 [Pseudomonas syringae]|uniref:Delta-60 repeat protein n=1 Tax=Pseudomonas syringae TaxID=317 RepID=A0A3T0JZ01_PSESX|nr:hypothetical protein CT157_22645 [Pseudomonas syringae]
MNTKNNQSPVGVGRIDPTFGTDGRFTPVSPDPEDQIVIVKALTCDEDKTIYCAGYVLDARGRSEYFCIHLSERGVLDTAFGENGYARGTFDLPGSSSTQSEAEHILIQNVDGVRKIVLVGTSITGSHSKSALTRLESNGSVDRSYGTDGVTVIDLPTRERKADEPSQSTSGDAGNGHGTRAISLPDNKVVLVRDGRPSWDFRTGSYIIRVNPDGSLDRTFNKDGYTFLFLEEANETQLRAITVTDDDKYVAAGSVYYSEKPGEALFVQLDSNGQFDQSFNKKGYLTIGQLPDTEFHSYQLINQPNKRILGVGHTTAAATAGLLISRERDGSANIQFNGGKPLLSILENQPTIWTSGKAQADGHVLITGGGVGGNFVIARVLNEGELDTSFGEGAGFLHFAGTRTNYSRPVTFEDRSVLFYAVFATPKGEQFSIARGLLD